MRYLLLLLILATISCKETKKGDLQEDKLVIDFIENVKEKSSHTERIIKRHGGNDRFPQYLASIENLRNVLGNIKMVYKYSEVDQADSLLHFETKNKFHKIYRDTINYFLNKDTNAQTHIDICFWSQRMLDFISSDVYEHFWHIDSLKPLVVHHKDEDSDFYKCYMVAKPFARGTAWYSGQIDTTENNINSYQRMLFSSKDPYYAIYPVKGRTTHDTLDVAWRQFLPDLQSDTIVILKDVIKY